MRDRNLKHCALLAAIYLLTGCYLDSLVYGQQKEPDLVLHVETGHQQWITSAVFSPDGKIIASASIDDTVRLWDAASGKELKILAGHHVSAFDSVDALAFSPDGKLLASGADDGIRIWDVQTGEEKQELVGHTTGINALAFSPSGESLASISSNLIRLWEVKSWSPVESFSTANSSNCMFFSNDGKQLIFADEDEIVFLDLISRKERLRLKALFTINSFSLSHDHKLVAVSNNWYSYIQLFDVDSGRLLKKLEGHTDNVNSVSFSPNNNRLASASGSKDRSVRIWDTKLGVEEALLNGHEDSVRSVTFSPDGATIVSVGGGLIGGTSIKKWNATTGEQMNEFRGRDFELNKLAVSPDGSMIAVGAGNRMVKNSVKGIRLWNLTAGNILRVFTDHDSSINSIAFSPDNKRLASGGGNGITRLWDIESGQVLKSFEAHTSDVSTLAFSHDGRRLVTAGQRRGNSEISVWDLESGRIIMSFKGHSNYVHAVAFSRDDKMIVSGSSDHSTKVWNVASGQEILSFGDQVFFSVKTLAISRDGRFVASGSLDNTIKLWDRSSGEELRTFVGHKRDVESIAFSPDGKTLVSGGNDEMIKTWDVASGKEIKTFRPSTNEQYRFVNAVTYSPDGKLIATGSSAIKIWDANSGQEIKSMAVNGIYSVSEIKFFPDGTKLVYNTDKDLVIWDVVLGIEIRRLTGHTEPIRSLDISVDGNLIVSSGEDNTIRVWDFNTGNNIRTIQENGMVFSVAISNDGAMVAAGGKGGGIRFWDLRSGSEIKTVRSGEAMDLAFLPNGRAILAAVGNKATSIDVATGKKISDFIGTSDAVVDAVAFSDDGQMVISGNENKVISIVNIASNKKRRQLKADSIGGLQEILTLSPDYFLRHQYVPLLPGLNVQVRLSNVGNLSSYDVLSNSHLSLHDPLTNKLLAYLISLDGDEWVVTTPDGRFDTSRSLDGIKGLHWIVNDEILKPVPLEAFMRHYYEPNLLGRIMKCNKENTCDKEFKPLPSIGAINRVQSRVEMETGKRTQ